MSVSREPGHDPGVPSNAEGIDGAKPKLADSLVIATELWIGVIVAHIVTTFALFGQQRKMIQDVVAGQVGRDSQEFTTFSSTGFIVSTMVVGLVIQIGVAVALLILTRKGYNWSRFLLSAVSMYIVIATVFSLFGEVSPRWAMIPNVIGGVAALGAAVLLMRRESDAYCRKMAEYRRSGSRPVAPPYPGYSAPGGYPGNQNHYPGADAQNHYPGADAQGNPYGQYPGTGSYPGYPPAQYPNAGYPQNSNPGAGYQGDGYPQAPYPHDPYAQSQNPAGATPVSQPSVEAGATSQHDSAAPSSSLQQPSSDNQSQVTERPTETGPTDTEGKSSDQT